MRAEAFTRVAADITDRAAFMRAEAFTRAATVITDRAACMRAGAFTRAAAGITDRAACMRAGAFTRAAAGITDRVAFMRPEASTHAAAGITEGAACMRAGPSMRAAAGIMEGAAFMRAEASTCAADTRLTGDLAALERKPPNVIGDLTSIMHCQPPKASVFHRREDSGEALGALPAVARFDRGRLRKGALQTALMLSLALTSRRRSRHRVSRSGAAGGESPDTAPRFGTPGAYPLLMELKAGPKFLFYPASLSENRFALFRTHSRRSLAAAGSLNSA